MTTQFTEKRLHRQGSVQSSSSSNDAAAAGAGGVGVGGSGAGGAAGSGQHQRHHEIVQELAGEEVGKALLLI